MRRRVLGAREGRRRLAALAGALTATPAMLVWVRRLLRPGATSAFLSSPETGEPAGLYYSDREYKQLESLLQAGTLGAPPEGVTADRRITGTWLIHDVEPWRVDWIFPVTDGEDVWVRQAMNLTEPTRGSWHLSPHPERLRALLADLGLLGKPDGGEDLSAFSLREGYGRRGGRGCAGPGGGAVGGGACGAPVRGGGTDRR